MTLERPAKPASLVATARSHPLAVAAAGAAGLLLAAALFNRSAAKAAERRDPPRGRFLEVGAVRLHYVERGEGEPLVLLHGNGSMIQDFETSGLIELAARKYRVIVFDRPGFGYSSRPRRRIWTPDTQAELIHAALGLLGVPRAIVLGHSWGASLAVAFALRYSEAVSALVLASGYYYPTLRPDMVAMSGPAVPVLGDLMRYTISPILGRLLWGRLMRKIFGPAPVPAKFRGFSREMALRPWQLRASAAESALTVPDAWAARLRYGDLRMPVVIIAGAEDRVVDCSRQSARLHEDVVQSTFHRIPAAGHMVHQTATELVMAAIDEAAAAGRRQSPAPAIPSAAA